MDTADTNNVFAVTLRTVPTDSTGVAHILEHTTLCGSKVFPVRDPFFHMLKRSLNTFMNAMTSADWTCFPFATKNEQDYHNLLSVYLDSVFFPNLNKLDFMQEGHRYEFETLDDSSTNLLYKGVVYNEMKGNMSNPDDIFNYELQKHLFQNSNYKHNFGGDPPAIPKLTHQQLLDFHSKFSDFFDCSIFILFLLVFVCLMFMILVLHQCEKFLEISNNCLSVVLLIGMKFYFLFLPFCFVVFCFFVF